MKKTTYIHNCVIVVYLFQDLTWQVVERDKVCYPLFGYVFNHYRIDNTFTWQQVVTQFLLIELEANLAVLHLLFVQGEHLWQVF